MNTIVKGVEIPAASPNGCRVCVCVGGGGVGVCMCSGVCVAGCVCVYIIYNIYSHILNHCFWPLRTVSIRII